MQIMIPTYAEQEDDKGKYIVFDIFFNTMYFASIRYSSFFTLHQKLIRAQILPADTPFPPKKLLNLGIEQILERKNDLEKYLQYVLRIPSILEDEIMTEFLRNAQQISFQVDMFAVKQQILLPNGDRIEVDGMSTDTCDELLSLIASQLQLPQELMHHYGLVLTKNSSMTEDFEELEAPNTPISDLLVKSKPKDLTSIRFIESFEAPYLIAEGYKTNKILCYRTKFFDPVYVSEILPHQNVCNLLYKQIIHEVKSGYLGKPDSATQDKMKALRAENDIKEFIKVSRNLPHFGSIHFNNCLVDSPESKRVSVKLSSDGMKMFEVHDTYGCNLFKYFMLQRIKCWRVSKQTKEEFNYNLYFEYLQSNGQLEWVRIFSQESFHLSSTLQAIINEFIMKKTSRDYKSLPIPSLDNRHSRKLNTFFKLISPTISENISPPNSNEAGNVFSYKIFSKLKSQRKSKTSISETFSELDMASPEAIKGLSVEAEETTGNQVFISDIGDDDL